MGPKISTASAYSTGVATLIAGLTLNEWAAAAGILGVLGTLAINWYFKRVERQAAAELEAVELRIKLQREELNALNLQGVRLRKPRSGGHEPREGAGERRARAGDTS
jgi:hypothetical protein